MVKRAENLLPSIKNCKNSKLESEILRAFASSKPETRKPALWDYHPFLSIVLLFGLYNYNIEA
jgi:hypothetical protein